MSRLTHKLLLTFIMLATLVVALGGYFVHSYQRYNHYNQQARLANQLLLNYSLLAQLSFEKLMAINEIVALHSVRAPQVRQKNETKLMLTQKTIRQLIVERIGLVPEYQFQAEQELLLLDSLHQIVTRIIDDARTVKEAIESGNDALAQHTLGQIREQQVFLQFDSLIDKAIYQEQARLESITKQEQLLYQQTQQALLAILFVVLLVSFGSVWFFSQRIHRAVNTLQSSLQRYAAGDYSSRVEMLADQEFLMIGQAFNDMARQIAEQQQAVQQSRDTLQQQVAERTEALSSSNAKLSKLDHSRRQFLADISHELRTPLTIIRGEAEVMLRYPPEQVDEYAEVLQRIVQQVAHTSALIDDLLFVARAEQGAPKLEQAEVDLVPLLRDVVQSYQGKASLLQQQVQWQCQEPELWVLGDARRLKQVLMIVLENALRYSQAEAKTLVQLQVEHDFAKLSVVDSGVGISEQDVEWVFERFYRGHNAKQHSDGMGLGLPVAKTIIDVHGGHISMSNNQGPGCTVTVRLPRLFIEDSHATVID